MAKRVLRDFHLDGVLRDTAGMLRALAAKERSVIALGKELFRKLHGNSCQDVVGFPLCSCTRC